MTLANIFTTGGVNLEVVGFLTRDEWMTFCCTSPQNNNEGEELKAHFLAMEKQVLMREHEALNQKPYIPPYPESPMLDFQIPDPLPPNWPQLMMIFALHMPLPPYEDENIQKARNYWWARENNFKTKMVILAANEARLKNRFTIHSPEFLTFLGRKKKRITGQFFAFLLSRHAPISADIMTDDEVVSCVENISNRALRPGKGSKKREAALAKLC